MKITKQEYIELQSDLAELHVEETVSDPWGEGLILFGDPEGVYTYTDEAQEVFNAASDAIDFILSQYLEVGET